MGKSRKKSMSSNYEKIIRDLENKIKSEKNKHTKKVTQLVHNYIYRSQSKRRKWKNNQ